MKKEETFMMKMLVTLYVPRTAPLAAALEEKAAQGAQRNVRGGLPGAPCAVCGEQGRGQKDVHVKAQTGRAGRLAGNENARGALGRADEGPDGMRNGVRAEVRADCAGRPAGNESARGALGCADEGPDGMRSGVYAEARAGRADKNRSGVWKDACPEQSGEICSFQSGGEPRAAAARGVRPGGKEDGARAEQCGACGARGESRAQAACGEEAMPGAGQAARRAAHGTRGMPLQEKLDAVDEYCTGDSLYTVAASHGIALAAAHRLTASRTLLQENERRRRRLIELVCGARPPVRPVCRGCMWGCRATGLCTQPRCLKEEGPRG